MAGEDGQKLAEREEPQPTQGMKSLEWRKKVERGPTLNGRLVLEAVSFIIPIIS